MALDTVTGAKAKTYTVAGPASYAAGGFLLDVSTDFSTIGFVDITVVTRGLLPACDFEILPDRDLASAEALGKAVIKVVRGRYDRATVGDPSGLPGGTAMQSVLFAAASATGSSHTHTQSHDHGLFATGTSNDPGVVVALNALGNGHALHTHTIDFPAGGGNTGVSTHAHNRDFEYEHTHPFPVATVDVAAVELPAATDLSATTFKVLVFGFGRG